MRVTGFHVDGFGLLHDQRVDGIGPGTTVVLGPNEAGKSTLHAFLVRTLFGHPRANDADGRNRHEPLRGGRHGGVVVAEDEAGRWEVHRYTEGSPRLRVVAPDGSESVGTDAVLPLLGRTVDEARYEQVFAIDLDDLAGVGSLGGGSLDDLLFDAATVGTGRSLRAARDEATERRDALWTPAASKRPLAAAMTRRAEARDALAAARDAARANLDLRRRLDAAAAHVDDLAEQQEQQAARIALLERVRDAWPSWSRAEELRADLDGQPDARVDPAVLTAVREAATELADARRRRDELVEERGELANRLDALAVDTDALAVADEVEALAEGLGAHELAVEQFAGATSDLEAAERAVERALAEVGEDWDETRVAAVAIDAASRERLAAAGDALRDAAAADAAAADAAEEARRTAARRTEAVQDAVAALPDAPAEAEVEASEQAVAVLRGGVPALVERRDAPAATPAGGFPVAATVLLAAAAVLLVPSVFGLLPDGVPAALVAGVGAVLGGVGAYLVGSARRGTPATASRRFPDDLEEEIARAARRVGLEDRPSLGDVERVAGRIEHARRTLREQADARRHLERLRTEAEEAARAARDRTDAADAQAAAHDDAAGTWAAVCSRVGLEAEDPRVVLTRHDRVAATHRALLDRRAAAERVAAVRPRVEGFRDEVTAVLGKVGRDVQGQEAVRLLPGLRDRVRAARDAQADRERLGGRLDELSARIEQLEARVAAATGDRDAALAAADVTDLAALEELAGAADARAGVAEELRAVTRNLDQLLGAGPRGEESRELLRQADPTAWEQELAAVRSARQATATERDEALAERTELEAELRRLGGDDAVPRAEQELAAAESEVAELAERWAVADTAARLLEATVARFEREQQPRVLTRASELLQRATGGQWAQVRRLDEQVVVARSEGGDPVPAEVLSRGTREQLWLCLRLALAEDLSHDRPLPLLVDDLLGTSDPERSLHVARVLADVARRQQVWLFTCHPRTAKLVTSVDPSAGVLRLRRGGKVVGLDRREVELPDDGSADTTPTLQFDD